MHLLRRAVRAVDPASQVAGRRIIGHYPGLVIVVVILTVTVIKARGPGAVKTVLGIQLGNIGITIGDIKGFIETGFTIDVDRVAGIEVENGAAVKRGAVIAM